MLLSRGLQFPAGGAERRILQLPAGNGAGDYNSQGTVRRGLVAGVSWRMSPDRLPHPAFLTVTGDAWETKGPHNTVRKPLIKKGLPAGDAPGNSKIKNSSSKVRRIQTRSQSCSFSMFDKSHFEEVSHRDCATKLKNLSLGQKDRNSKKITRNVLNPGRKGVSLLRPNSSVQKKETSDYSTESCPRNAKSASSLKQLPRSSTSFRKLLKVSMAARESPSNLRPVTPTVPVDCSLLGEPALETDGSNQQLSTCCHNAVGYSPTNPLLQSFQLPGAAQDEDSASDLSDSERIPLVSSPCRPPDLNLRAEVIAPAELTQTCSCVEFSYPDFLPKPYASWNLRELSLLVHSSSNARSPVTARPLGLLESFVGRLLELEWLQLKTEQAERSKFTRPRSNTAAGGCNPTRHPGRGRRACLMVNRGPSNPGDPAIGLTGSAASTCSHCRLQYPYCSGTCRPSAFQNFSRSASAKPRGPDSQLGGGGPPRARAVLSPKEVALGKGPSETTRLGCSSAVKGRKQPPHAQRCPPPCSWHSSSASLRRLCMIHQGGVGSREQSFVGEEDFILDDKSQRISNSVGKGKRLHKCPK
ncbi:uncharacterized protein fam217ba [Hemiscyllium ocellatum]|uniref:uncharacterized protein fam217ba n=1 Tax=Hemiscyllium ocellatum TaxID=170820 RepID=UPI002966F3B3|nr:uncharacterized protein fam217ba [Hemiscyllium ocellatum]